jgi:SAM-dependent methyltransferase
LKNVENKPNWLDIGAGDNILIKEQPGSEIGIGIDIELRPETFVDNEMAYFCLASSDNIPFKNDTFDFITSRYTFEHLENPEKTLSEIDRVLKSDGYLIIQTTNKWNPYLLISRLIPFGFKKWLLKKLFKEIPSGTFKTYYKINTVKAFKQTFGSLELTKLILIEDLFCQSRPLFELSSIIYRLINLFGFDSLKGNIIVIYQKK